MHHVEGCDRDQAQLLPARVDDYVHRDNPVRFIDAFVDDLDLNEAGFSRVEPKDTGRPAYDPADLFKLYIYGYIDRVRSSRRLEIEARRNLEVIGYCADCDQTSRLSPISARITAVPSRRCSANSCCCAAGSISLAVSSLRSTAPG